MDEDLSGLDVKLLIVGLAIMFGLFAWVTFCLNGHYPCPIGICDPICSLFNTTKDCQQPLVTINQCDNRTCYWRTIRNDSAVNP